MKNYHIWYDSSILSLRRFNPTCGRVINSAKADAEVIVHLGPVQLFASWTGLFFAITGFQKGEAMLYNLGAYLKSKRLNKGLNCQQLASVIGYRKFNKGARKIEKAEKGGVLSGEMMEKITSALDLDQDRIDEAVWKDKEAFETWLNEPVPRELIIRLMAAVYYGMIYRKISSQTRKPSNMQKQLPLNTEKFAWL